MVKADLERQKRLLLARRAALLEQLAAVDKALATLTTGTSEAITEAAGLVVPTRVAPARILSDDHRQASIEGRRKARHSREAAAGRAREALDPSPRAASTATRHPRLVKREKRR